MAHAGGRPKKWSTPEALQKDIDAYFASCPRADWTITGLALAMNTTRQLICNYEEQDEFVDTVKKAKLMVEATYEELLKQKGHAGSIFGLKNFGWRDQQDHDVKSDGKRLEMPTPIFAYVSSNNSNQENNANVQASENSAGGNECVKDNLNSDVPHSQGTVGQDTNNNVGDIGNNTPPKEGGNAGLLEHIATTPLL